MAHLPDFISDLAIILIMAGIVTIVFKWLKQPVVLGYIVAGFISSIHFRNMIESTVKRLWGNNHATLDSLFNILPEVSDMTNVSIWAEIGVIFLLFALGLEFSSKKLADVGGTAFIATSINMCAMVLLGYTVGRLLDWSQMNSIFLGCMLSMSSTTIIIKAFKDMDLQKKKFAGIVFAMLIVEDLGAVLILVLLSTLAVSEHFAGEQLVGSIFKLIFFIIIWFLVGIYIIPTMLKRLKKYLNDETLLIVAIGLCLGMVLFASGVGFSAALGAFVTGSILAETVESKHIEHLTEPLKNLFGAVFFVSVGMMIDPKVIVDYVGLILLISLVIILGRTTFATLGVLASGQSLRIALQCGYSLGQIGEFSFIIATLGVTLGVIDQTLYPVIVSASVLTTFTTPYAIRAAEPVYGWVEKRIPAKWSRIIEGYAASDYSTVNKTSDWKKLMQAIVKIVIVYFTLSLAVVLISQRFVTPFILTHVDGDWGASLAAIITLVAMAPFLRAIMMKKNRSVEFKNLWTEDKRFNKGVLVSQIAFRILLCVALILMVLIPLFPRFSLSMVIIALVVTTLIIFSQGFKQQSRRIEARFLENLNFKQKMEEMRAAISPTVANDLRSKNIHIEEFEVSQSSPSVGKTLQELNFRQRTGVNIVTIIRGSKKINIPDGNVYLYPFDKLVVAGSDEEIQKFEEYLKAKKAQISEIEEEAQYHICLSQYAIDPNSKLVGQTLRTARIREKTECMVIGVDRNNESIIQIMSDFMFQEGDIIWLAGERNKLNSFEENING